MSTEQDRSHFTVSLNSQDLVTPGNNSTAAVRVGGSGVRKSGNILLLENECLSGNGGDSDCALRDGIAVFLRLSLRLLSVSMNLYSAVTGMPNLQQATLSLNTGAHHRHDPPLGLQVHPQRASGIWGGLDIGEASVTEKSHSGASTCPLLF